jgi:hypothetical protein
LPCSIEAAETSIEEVVQHEVVYESFKEAITMIVNLMPRNYSEQMLREVTRAML